VTNKEDNIETIYNMQKGRTKLRTRKIIGGQGLQEENKEEHKEDNKRTTGA
jgi:hypothetical protein